MFTDCIRFAAPYADSKATSEPGYLAQKFKEIRERQAEQEMEKKSKVRDMKRAAR